MRLGLSFFLFVFFLLPNVVFSQVSITYPYNRQIFQRDNNNEAQFSILGACPKNTTRVQYKLVPIQLNQGVSINWTDLPTNPLGGFFQGQISAKGGWYSLHVRVFEDGTPLDSSILSRVGVGENFIIAGQSNAQGTQKFEGDVAAQDDRVNVASFSNMISSINPATDEFVAIQSGSFDYPENVFKQLSSNAVIGPTGGTSYYWANLGDSLAKKLNVPICFFNAAWGGTSIRNWVESSRGQLTELPWVAGLYYQKGYPYTNLKKVAEVFGKKNGVRAVLWHQGETDAYQRMLPSVYQAYLKELINNFRKDIGEEIPWVIAQSSYYAIRYENGTCEVSFDSKIADAQLDFLTSSSLSQLYQGPNTDSIELPRNSDEIAYCVHFSRNYFNEVANVWLDKLNNQFFSKAKPTSGHHLPLLEKQCGIANANQIVINTSYEKIQLFNDVNQLVGSEKEYANLRSGSYSLVLEDSLGLKFKMPSFTLQNFSIARPLVLSVSKDSTYCEGTLSELSVGKGFSAYKWNTGDSTRVVKLSASGSFQVQVRDENNCTSSTELIKLTRIPKPNKPIIIANSDLTFCDGFKVDLLATNGLGKYEWNTGEKTQIVTRRTSGIVKALTVDANDCKSEYSDSLRINVLPLPSPPTLSALGDTLFCDGKSVELLAKNGAEKLIWSTGETLPNIKVVKSGTYQVATTDSNKCQSKPSNSIYVKVWPNPLSPAIQALSDTVFCDGASVRLFGQKGAGKFEWSTGQTSDSILVKKSGIFQLRTIDANQCVSPFSTTVYVKVNPNPARPIIQTKGDTLICKGNSVELTATSGSKQFIWKSGETSTSIVVNRAGVFSVATIDGNSCKSEFSVPVRTQLFDTPVSTNISLSSPYFLYGGLKLVDTEYNWAYNKVPLSEKGVYLRVQEAGNYSIMVSKKYVNGPTCVSPTTEFSYKFPEDGGLSIYPNPSRNGDLVNIQSISSLKNATYFLYAFDGRLMSSGKINEDGLYGFRVSELAEGKYILVVNTDNHVYEKALIVSNQ
jgi:Carbohydrate esterase, sialic acid-specific acetylesterase